MVKPRLLNDFQNGENSRRNNLRKTPGYLNVIGLMLHGFGSGMVGLLASYTTVVTEQAFKMLPADTLSSIGTALNVASTHHTESGIAAGVGFGVAAIVFFKTLP